MIFGSKRDELQDTGEDYTERRLINYTCTECYFGAYLTLSLLIWYIYGAPCKARNFNVVYKRVYMDLRLATLKAVCFYLLHNVLTLNQCIKLSCGTVVRKHFAIYQG
jgi:hypothetical protein